MTPASDASQRPNIGTDTWTNIAFLVPWLFAPDVPTAAVMGVVGLNLAWASSAFHFVEDPWTLGVDKWATVSFTVALTACIWSLIMGGYAWTVLALIPVYFPFREILPPRGYWWVHVAAWGGASLLGVALISGWWATVPLAFFAAFGGSVLFFDHRQDSLSHALSHVWAALAAATGLAVLTTAFFPLT